MITKTTYRSDDDILWKTAALAMRRDLFWKKLERASKKFASGSSLTTALRTGGYRHAIPESFKMFTKETEFGGHHVFKPSKGVYKGVYFVADWPEPSEDVWGVEIEQTSEKWNTWNLAAQSIQDGEIFSTTFTMKELERFLKKA